MMPSIGLQVRRELEQGIPPATLSQVCGQYVAAAPNADAALSRLRAATGGQVDPASTTHLTALLGWLREWGCRHLARSAQATITIPSLLAWWNGGQLLTPHLAALSTCWPTPRWKSQQSPLPRSLVHRPPVGIARMDLSM
jgi:hypothetical protein